jgi:hypothetical protein
VGGGEWLQKGEIAVRSKALRDLNLEPVRAADAPWGLSRAGGALPPSQEALLLAPVSALVSEEDFALPLGCETAGRVVCSYCAETGDTVEGVRHRGWCIYVDGPICPEVPN